MNTMLRTASFVHESELHGVQCLIVHLVGRPKSNDLRARYDFDLTEHAIEEFIRLGTQGIRELSFSVHRNTA